MEDGVGFVLELAFGALEGVIDSPPQRLLRSLAIVVSILMLSSPILVAWLALG